MRILYVCSQTPLGSPERQPIRAFAREAAARGHDPHVLLFTQTGHHAKFPRIPSRAITTVTFDKATHGFDLPAVAGRGDHPFTPFGDLTEQQLDRYLEVIEEGLQGAVRGWKPEVVHVDELWLAAAMARSIFHDVPVIAACRGIDLAAARRFPSLTRRVVPPARELDRVLIATAEHARQAGEVYGIRSDRLQVLGYGVDGSVYYPPELAVSGEFRRAAVRHDLQVPSRAALRVVYAGSLANPGLEVLMEGMKNPAARGAHLLLVHDGTLKPRGITDRLADNPAVHLVEIAEPSVVAEVLRGCHASLVLGEAEQVAPAVLESLACGCRVMMPDLFALRDWPSKGIVESGAVERVSVLGELQTPEKHISGVRPSYLRVIEEFGTALSALLDRGRHGRLDHTAVRVHSRLSWDAQFRVVERLYATVSGGL